MSSFPCTKCGLCCKNAGAFIEQANKLLAAGNDDPLLKEFVGFPHKILENGSCEHLQPDNTCGIYDTRPDVCNNDIVYEKHFAGKITKEEFNQVSARNCNIMIDGAGLSDKYLVKL